MSCTIIILSKQLDMTSTSPTHLVCPTGYALHSTTTLSVWSCLSQQSPRPPGYVCSSQHTLCPEAGQFFKFPSVCPPGHASHSQIMSPKWLARSSAVQLSASVRLRLAQHNYTAQVDGQINNYCGPLSLGPLSAKFAVAASFTLPLTARRPLSQQLLQPSFLLKPNKRRLTVWNNQR